MKVSWKLAIAALGLLFIASDSKAQVYSVEGGWTQDFYPDAMGEFDCKIHFTNGSKSDVTLSYKKINIDYPAKWGYTICDNNGCFATWPASGTMAPYPSNDPTATFKLSVYPNGFADTGKVQYAFWDVSNPSHVDTLTYNIYVRWGVNVSGIESNVSVFPIPANSSLNVYGQNSISEIQVYALDGKNVAVNYEKTQFNEAKINTANLQGGMYFLTYLDGSTLRKVRISVQH